MEDVRLHITRHDYARLKELSKLERAAWDIYIANAVAGTTRMAIDARRVEWIKSAERLSEHVSFLLRKDALMVEVLETGPGTN
jgi:hypothetical protein